MSKNEKNPQKTAENLFEHFQHYYVYENAFEGEKEVRRPRATVVIGKTKEGVLCRGISICSLSQNFDRKDGIDRATGRMVAAAIRQECTEPMKGWNDRTHFTNFGAEVVDTVLGEEAFLETYKSAWNVVPTPKEEKMLDVSEKKEVAQKVSR